MNGLVHSLGEMPAGEAENGQRRGHSFRDDLAGLRKLRGRSQDLSDQVSRSKLKFIPSPCYATCDQTLSPSPLLALKAARFCRRLIILLDTTIARRESGFEPAR